MRKGAQIGSIAGYVGGLAHGAYVGAQNVDAAQKQVKALGAEADNANLALEKEKAYADVLSEERKQKETHDPKKSGGRG